MKKITPNSFHVILLCCLLGILLFGRLSPVAAQSTSENEPQFSWLLSEIGSNDNTQIFLIDEDNGSTIEAKVGQTITVMFNYPRISTKDEKEWNDRDAKRDAWSYTEESDKWTGWTYWAKKVPLLKEKGDANHKCFDLVKEKIFQPDQSGVLHCVYLGYPNDNMHRLTDEDFNLLPSDQIPSHLCYPRWAYYQTFTASRSGTTKVYFECHKNKETIKVVTITFHITD